jgi:putative transcriptional regulator
MSRALEDKRTATRLRVLVEIADRQPAVSQGEIAEAVGVTSQAVSEYIRDLIEDGYVEKEGRSRYRTTKEGVDWLFREVKSIRQFVDHVTEDVLQSVQEDAAIATDRIEAGETVTLSLREGLLHATPGDEGPATGTATTDAQAGQDVSVTGFEGVIDMSPGTVTVCQVPRARNGGSRAVDPDALASSVDAADLVVAVGVEAVAALRRIDRDPAVRVAAGAVAAEAATKGQDVAVVSSVDEAGRVADALRDRNVTYELAPMGDTVA